MSISLGQDGGINVAIEEKLDNDGKTAVEISVTFSGKTEIFTSPYLAGVAYNSLLNDLQIKINLLKGEWNSEQDLQTEEKLLRNFRNDFQALTEKHQLPQTFPGG